MTRSFQNIWLPVSENTIIFERFDNAAVCTKKSLVFFVVDMIRFQNKASLNPNFVGMSLARA